jgi:hypothetical protein
MLKVIPGAVIPPGTPNLKEVLLESKDITTALPDSHWPVIELLLPAVTQFFPAISILEAKKGIFAQAKRVT